MPEITARFLPRVFFLFKRASIDAALVLALLAACSRREVSRATPTTDASEPAPAVVEEAAFVGVLIARDTLDVSANAPARIETIDVGIGQHVKAGDALVHLDRKSREQEYAAALAAKQGAKAGVYRARMQLIQAKEQRQRRRGLADSLSREEIRSAEVAVDVAQAELKAAKGHEAEAEAALNKAKVGLKDTALRAPFDGVVTVIYQNPGAFAAAGTPIVRLIGNGDLLLRFAVPSEGHAAVGRPFKARFDEVGVELEGAADKVSPELDPASHMILVEAKLDAAKAVRDKLHAGLVAKVSWR